MVALSRPIRLEAPPASTIAASGAAEVTTTSVLFDVPSVLATKQGLQSGGVAGLGFHRRGDLIARHLVVRRPVHLTEDTHHGVVEVLLGKSRQRERVRGIRDVGVV